MRVGLGLGQHLALARALGEADRVEEAEGVGDPWLGVAVRFRDRDWVRVRVRARARARARVGVHLVAP